MTARKSSSSGNAELLEHLVPDQVEPVAVVAVSLDELGVGRPVVPCAGSSGTFLAILPSLPSADSSDFEPVALIVEGGRPAHPIEDALGKQPPFGRREGPDLLGQGLRGSGSGGAGLEAGMLRRLLPGYLGRSRQRLHPIGPSTRLPLGHLRVPGIAVGGSPERRTPTPGSAASWWRSQRPVSAKQATRPARRRARIPGDTGGRSRGSGPPPDTAQSIAMRRPWGPSCRRPPSSSEVTVITTPLALRMASADLPDPAAAPASTAT